MEGHEQVGAGWTGASPRGDRPGDDHESGTPQQPSVAGVPRAPVGGPRAARGGDGLGGQETHRKEEPCTPPSGPHLQGPAFRAPHGSHLCRRARGPAPLPGTGPAARNTTPHPHTTVCGAGPDPSGPVGADGHSRRSMVPGELQRRRAPGRAAWDHGEAQRTRARARVRRGRGAGGEGHRGPGPEPGGAVSTDARGTTGAPEHCTNKCLKNRQLGRKQ